MEVISSENAASRERERVCINDLVFTHWLQAKKKKGIPSLLFNSHKGVCVVDIPSLVALTSPVSDFFISKRAETDRQ